jgi:hypothetical protein
VEHCRVGLSDRLALPPGEVFLGEPSDRGCVWWPRSLDYSGYMSLSVACREVGVAPSDVGPSEVESLGEFDPSQAQVMTEAGLDRLESPVA